METGNPLLRGQEYSQPRSPSLGSGWGPAAPQGHAGWGVAGLVATPTSHPRPCPETWLGLAERPKLPEPKIAPDAGGGGGAGGSAGMCQGRSHLGAGASPRRGTAPLCQHPAGWDPAGAACPVGSVSGPRCCRLALSSASFRASVSPRSQSQARAPRGPLHRRLPSGYFRAGCGACAFFFPYHCLAPGDEWLGAPTPGP